MGHLHTNRTALIQTGAGCDRTLLLYDSMERVHLSSDLLERCRSLYIACSPSVLYRRLRDTMGSIRCWCNRSVYPRDDFILHSPKKSGRRTDCGICKRIMNDTTQQHMEANIHHTNAFLCWNGFCEWITSIFTPSNDPYLDAGSSS